MGLRGGPALGRLAAGAAGRSLAPTGERGARGSGPPRPPAPDPRPPASRLPGFPASRRGLRLCPERSGAGRGAAGRRGRAARRCPRPRGGEPCKPGLPARGGSCARRARPASVSPTRDAAARRRPGALRDPRTPAGSGKGSVFSGSAGGGSSGGAVDASLGPHAQLPCLPSNTLRKFGAPVASRRRPLDVAEKSAVAAAGAPALRTGPADPLRTRGSLAPAGCAFRKERDGCGGAGKAPREPQDAACGRFRPLLCVRMNCASRCHGEELRCGKII